MPSPREGIITLQKKLDYESGPKVFQLNITASDSGSSPLSNWTLINIYVIDEDDQNPVFEKDFYEASIVEEIDVSGRPPSVAIRFFAGFARLLHINSILVETSVLKDIVLQPDHRTAGPLISSMLVPTVLRNSAFISLYACCRFSGYDGQGKKKRFYNVCALGGLVHVTADLSVSCNFSLATTRIFLHFRIMFFAWHDAQLLC